MKNLANSVKHIVENIVVKYTTKTALLKHFLIQLGGSVKYAINGLPISIACKGFDVVVREMEHQL